MMLKKIAARVGATAAAAGLALAVTTGTANADPNAAWIGYGYSTNTHAVWCVQHDINYFLAHNYYRYTADIPVIAPLVEDGAWGPKTYEAVKWFQHYTVYGQPDGIVGGVTGSNLLSTYGGDPYYNGTYDSSTNTTHPGYCYWYLPGVIG